MNLKIVLKNKYQYDIKDKKIKTSNNKFNHKNEVCNFKKNSKLLKQHY